MSELETLLQSCEKRFKDHASRQADMGDVESVDFVVNMIAESLQDAHLLDPPDEGSLTLHAIDLTLNVAAVHDEGGHVKFSVFGLEGDVGASHRADDTHAIKFSFQPEDLTGSTTASDETGTQPTSALSPENELLQSFKELKALMVDADRQKGRPREATINLNFVVQEDFSISLVAAGQAETSTTHSVCLGFDRSKHEVSLRS